MSWIVLIDLRRNNGHIVNIEDEHGNIAQFGSKQDARDAVQDHPLGSFPCYAVNIEREEMIYL